jgi:hypothetical protein
MIKNSIRMIRLEDHLIESNMKLFQNQKENKLKRPTKQGLFSEKEGNWQL